MGQKVNPISFRTGKFLPWKSRWFADDKTFKDLLIEDIKIRSMLFERLKTAGLTNVEIERLPGSLVVNLTVSRPGVAIGRGGSGLEEIKKEIIKSIRKTRKTTPKDLKIDLNVKEVRNPEISAYLVATRIVSDLERRMPHRRVIARSMDRVMSSGADGIKIVISGRIRGANIARTEKYQQGAVPTQTLRKNIDYAQVPALLKKGYVGVKVWINKPDDDQL